MPVSITVAPSPNKQKALNLAESRYLLALGAELAEGHPRSTVITRYGDQAMDTLVMRRAVEDDTELF